MKKTVLLSTVITFLFFSCEKELNNIEPNVTEKLVEPTVQLLESMSLSCNSDSDDNCTMLFEAKKGTLACSCSESKMLFQTDNSEKRDISIISPYLNYFGKYLEKKHQISNSNIESVEYSLFDKSEVVTIKYLTSDNRLSSVMYITTLDKANDKTVEIDCTGNCDSGSYVECTEVYSTVTGDISCSCSGCKMTITTVD